MNTGPMEGGRVSVLGGSTTTSVRFSAAGLSLGQLPGTPLGIDGRFPGVKLLNHQTVSCLGPPKISWWSDAHYPQDFIARNHARQAQQLKHLV